MGQVLHRGYQRHGISRLPDVEGDQPAKKAFKAYPIGYFHIDIAEVRTEEGKLHLFVAIDRTSKFAFAELHEKAAREIAAAFLKALIEAVPYKIHTVLTDNGTHFTTPGNESSAAPLIKLALKNHEIFRAHAFELACARNDIEHRLTKPKHRWTNGQVERMNRTLKEATVRRYHYDSHSQFREHLATFLAAYNFAKRLKTLRGLTPHEYICKCWTEKPDQFRLDPSHHKLGPNRLARRLSIIVEILAAKRDTVNPLGYQCLDLVLDPVLSSPVPETGRNLPGKANTAIGLPKSRAPAFEFSAPPLNAAVTFRQPRLAKAKESWLHSVCIGASSCVGKILSDRRTFADSEPRCTYSS